MSTRNRSRSPVRVPEGKKEKETTTQVETKTKANPRPHIVKQAAAIIVEAGEQPMILKTNGNCLFISVCRSYPSKLSLPLAREIIRQLQEEKKGVKAWVPLHIADDPRYKSLSVKDRQRYLPLARAIQLKCKTMVKALREVLPKGEVPQAEGPNAE